MDLHEEISQAQQQFVQAVASGNGMDSFLDLWLAVSAKIDLSLKQGELSEAALELGTSLARAVQIVSEGILNLSSQSAASVNRAVDSSAEYLRNAGSSILNLSSISNSLPDTSTTPSFTAYRSFILTHLSHPYPTVSERAKLLLTTGQNKTQFSNWFINNRRRSGWAAMYKDFAHSTREELEILIARVEKWEEDGKGNERIIGEREALRKVRAWCEMGGRDTLHEGIVDAIGTESHAVEEIVDRKVNPKVTRKAPNRPNIDIEDYESDIMTTSESDDDQDGDFDVGVGEIQVGYKKRVAKPRPNEPRAAVNNPVNSTLYRTPRRPPPPNKHRIQKPIETLPFPLIPSRSSSDSSVISYASTTTSEPALGYPTPYFANRSYSLPPVHYPAPFNPNHNYPELANGPIYEARTHDQSTNNFYTPLPSMKLSRTISSPPTFPINHHYRDNSTVYAAPYGPPPPSTTSAYFYQNPVNPDYLPTPDYQPQSSYNAEYFEPPVISPTDPASRSLARTSTSFFTNENYPRGHEMNGFREY